MKSRDEEENSRTETETEKRIADTAATVTMAVEEKAEDPDTASAKAAANPTIAKAPENTKADPVTENLAAKARTTKISRQKELTIKNQRIMINSFIFYMNNLYYFCFLFYSNEKQ